MALATYPNRLIGGLVFGIVVAIMVNALLLQHSRHPAPLFHSATTLVPSPTEKPAQPSVQPAPAPAPAPKPADASQPTQDQIDQLLKSEAQPASSDPAARNQSATASAQHPTAHDAIGQLLTGNAPHEAGVEERPKTVLAVQRALLKLGFVVKPDGEMGAVTRRAVEQYERDHGLPVDGHLSAKFIHRLSADTGISID